MPKGSPRHDWDEMELLYVTSDVTLKAIGVQFNVNENMVRNKSSELLWSNKRSDFRNSMVDYGLDVARHLTVMDKTRFDTMASAAADILVAKSLHAIRDANILALIGDGGVKTLTSTIKDCLDIKYRILNVPAPTQPIDVSDLRAPEDFYDVDDRALAIAEGIIARGGFVTMPMKELPEPGGNGNGSS